MAALRELMGRKFSHLCRGNAGWPLDEEAGTAEVEGLTHRETELQ